MRSLFVDLTIGLAFAFSLFHHQGGSKVFAEPAVAFPPLRLAGLGGGAAVAPVAPPLAHHAAPLPSEPTGIVADEKWCGIELSPPPAVTALPCKYPGLPCGPVAAGAISRGAGELGDDLDGDGVQDLTLAGKRQVPKPEEYAAIYRGTDSGYILADYHVVPPRAEPTMASVLLTVPGSPPLVRDGYDIVESSGRTVSIARLRRFDGRHFRTLLTFCAHRAEPMASAPGGRREGHNRVDFIDIDKNGQKQVVVQGLITPVAFRFTDNGLALVRDSELTAQFLETNGEAKRARSLRAEANRLAAAGQLRRAADEMSRAHAATPYDLGLSIELSALLARAGDADKAIEILNAARFAAPDKAVIPCALARAHRALGDIAAERNDLRSCLGKSPDEGLRAEATARLNELIQ